MKFIRYRQNFAHGYGQWEYAEKPYYEEDFIQTLHEEYNWSDKYRGCDIEDIEQPPKEWIESKITEIQNRIKWATAQLNDYTEYLENYEHV